MWSKLKALVELDVPVRPMSSDCTCGDKHTGRQRAIAYDDGWDVSCLSCGARWVEWRLRLQTSGLAGS